MASTLSERSQSPHIGGRSATKGGGFDKFLNDQDSNLKNLMSQNRKDLEREVRDSLAFKIEETGLVCP